MNTFATTNKCPYSSHNSEKIDILLGAQTKIQNNLAPDTTKKCPFSSKEKEQKKEEEKQKKDEKADKSSDDDEQPSGGCPVMNKSKL